MKNLSKAIVAFSFIFASFGAMASNQAPKAADQSVSWEFESAPELTAPAESWSFDG